MASKREAQFRRMVEAHPGSPMVHFSLGKLLLDERRYAEAVESLRTAVRLQPDYAEAHCNLGIFLQQQGAYSEGLEMLRKGHELGSRRPDWQYPSAQWVADAERALTDAATALAWTALDVAIGAGR